MAMGKGADDDGSQGFLASTDLINRLCESHSIASPAPSWLTAQKEEGLRPGGGKLASFIDTGPLSTPGSRDVACATQV